MGNSGFSETKNADEIMAPCDPNIIPIFPVRYAIQEDTLLSLNTAKKEIKAPEKISDCPDHELTRIRQGFVYIFVPLTAEGGSNKEGDWHVFRYETIATEDDNSSHDIPFTETGLHQRYQFYKYNWVDGYAHGEWEADKTQIYPYAFVPLHTSKIEIAYCETRWPGHFFLQFELDPTLRAKYMREVDLMAEETDHSAPMSKLEEMVSDYAPGDQGAEWSPFDIVANICRATPIGSDRVSRVRNCSHTETVGRIVAVEDQLGELDDVGAFITCHVLSKMQYSAEYQYPLIIGDKIQQIREDLYNPWGWTGYPINEGEFDRERKALKDQEASFKTIEDLIFENLYPFALRSEAASAISGLIDMIELALKGLAGVSDNDSFQRFDFAFFTLGRLTEHLGTTANGSDAIVKAFEGKASPIKTLFEIVKDIGGPAFTIANNWAEKVAANRASYMRFLTAIGTEFGMVWGSGRGAASLTMSMHQRILKTATKVPMDPGTYDLGTVHGLSDHLKGRRVSVDDTTRILLRSMQDRWTGAVRYSHVSINEEWIPVSDFDAIARHTGVNLGQSAFAMFTASFQAAVVMKDWNKEKYSQSEFGAIANYPPIALSTNLLEVTESVYNLNKVFRGGAVTAMAGNTARATRIFGPLMVGVRNFSASAAMAMNGNGLIGGVSRAITRAGILAKVAGPVGIVLGLVQGAEAVKSGDTWAATGHASMAISAVVLMFATGPVGWVIGAGLLIVGLVMVLTGDDEFNKWARNSFWGNSEQYWDQERPSLQRRFNEAGVLSRPADPAFQDMKNKFDEEVRNFMIITAG